MVDFREIPADGEVRELFARDFLEELGFFIESPPDRGPDGGKDLIVREELSGYLGRYEFKWLVSCKHNAHSGKSVNAEDEINIMERVSRWKCDGFIGFYSTIPSSGLNDTLRGLKDNETVKDYKVFDGRLIESHLIRVGFSEILRRYFPASYREIKPLHLVVAEYIPLNCEVCGRDLLEFLYEKDYSSNIVYVTRQPSPTTNVRYVEGVYGVCKRCDREFQERYHSNTELWAAMWEDVSDLVIPAWFIRYLLTTMNNLRIGRQIYSDQAYEQEKKIMMALSQKVLREMTGRERERVVKLLQIPTYI